MPESVVNTNINESLNQQIADIAANGQGNGHNPLYWTIDPSTGIATPYYGTVPNQPVVVSNPTIPQTPNVPQVPTTTINPPTIIVPPTNNGVGKYPTSLDPIAGAGQSINLSLNIAPSQTSSPTQSSGQASDQASNTAIGSGNLSNIPVWALIGGGIIIVFGMMMLRR